MLVLNFTEFFCLKTDINHSFKKLSEQFIFSVFLAMLCTLIFGYQFNCGDQAEHLPQVYQKLNPQLYPNDFFLNLYNQTFTVRFYWVEVVTFFSRIFPVSVVCFSFYLICLVGCIYAWIKIAYHFTEQKWVSYLTVIFIFILFNKFTIGGNQLQGTIFLASNLAEVFSSFAILFFLKSKYKIAALFLAVGTLFQVLVGFQLWIVLTGVIVFSRKDKWFLHAAIFSVAYILLSLPILVPLLSKQFIIAEQYDKELYFKTVYVYRSILHFKPSLFPITDYIKLSLLLFPSLLILWFKKLNDKNVIWIFAVLILFGAVCYALLIDVAGVNEIGKLQWFKTTVWLNAFCCLLLADFIVETFRKYLFQLEILLNQTFLSMLSILILIVVLNGKYLPSEKLKARYQIGNYQQSDLQVVHQWINVNTPNDAILLVSPLDDAFACEAQRSQPVNFKAVVHEPFYFIKWNIAMRDYYNVDFEKVGNNMAITQAEFNFENVLKYPVNNLAQYRIDHLKQSKITSQLGEIIFKNGDWIVTKINK